METISMHDYIFNVLKSRPREEDESRLAFNHRFAKEYVFLVIENYGVSCLKPVPKHLLDEIVLRIEFWSEDFGDVDEYMKNAMAECDAMAATPITMI